MSKSNRQRWEEDFSEATGGYKWSPFKWLVGIFVAIVVLVLTGYVIKLIFVPVGVAEKVVNPDNVVFQYEKFHDACASIVAKDKNYETAKAEAEAHDKRTEGKDDPLGRNANESQRLHQVASGIKMIRDQEAEQYNSDSRKHTQKIFKAKGLPYRIEPGETPNCDGSPAQ